METTTSAHRLDLLDTLIHGTGAEEGAASAPKERPPRRFFTPPANVGHTTARSRSRSPRREEQTAYDRGKKTTRLRFKTSSSRRKKREHSHELVHDHTDNASRSPTSLKDEADAHRRKHRRRHHPSRHRSRPADHAPPTVDDEGLDPERAFRDSLFDALADDEGADYWSAVYGQDVREFTPYTTNEERGGVDRMDDEEYVAHVRQKMWEKTHEYLVEERDRREHRRKEAERRAAEEAKRAQNFNAEMEDSLRRGRERKDKKSWEDYCSAWARFVAEEANENMIPWPVRSRRREDVSKKSVEDYFDFGARVEGKELRTMLKVERVRWHPDKVQQRLGEGRMDDASRKAVTEVFQIVDDLFVRSKGA